MKTIRLLLEYGAYPVWIYDEDNCVIDTALPEEWENDVELDNAFTEIQHMYESLFVNNEKEFSFVGFKNEEDREISRERSKWQLQCCMKKTTVFIK